MAIGPRLAGACLIFAAVLFWIAWALMPGVGITDARQILDLVAQQRDSVRVSAILQLVSAAFYILALLELATFGAMTKQRTIGVGVLFLALGTLGSVADTMIHLLAYEMTAPGADRSQMIPVMDRVQGPDLALIAPLIASFFLGSIILAIGFARARWVTFWNPALYIIALGVVLLAGLVRPPGAAGSRMVGLIVLGAVSLSQVWLGVTLMSLRPPDSNRDLA